jgi:aconitate decarboxylase
VTSGSATKRLAGFSAGIKFDDLPDEVVGHAKKCILDTLGCALHGATLPWSRIALETVQDLGSVPVATVWGTPQKVSPADAALVNGTMVHAFELDDLHKKAIVHPGGVSIPAILAMCEHKPERTSGKQLLTAVVAGYETTIRVGLGVGLGLLHRGWHNNGILGTFGGAAGVANLLGLDAEGMEHAIGMAASQSSGLMSAQYGSMIKRMHAGKAAQGGLYAGVLASKGFTGIKDVLELPYGGFASTFADKYELENITDGLGDVWETPNVGFKFYSCCGSNHTTVDAIEQIREQMPFEAADVEAIDIKGSTATKDHVGWEYKPDALTTAQMNLSYAAAAAILFGSVFVEQFTEDLLDDARVLDLTRKVAVHADPEIDAKGRSFRHAVVVTVKLKGGRAASARVDHAKGSEFNPLTDQELSWKFRALAGKVLPDEQVDKLQDIIMNLDEVDDVQSLVEALSLAN